MKKHILSCILALSCCTIAVAQTNAKKYAALIRKGWTLHLAKKHDQAAILYEEAFKIQSKAPLNDRYNAACLHALANNAEQAFTQLFIAVKELQWYDIQHLKNDSDLTSLRTHEKWANLLTAMEQTKSEVEKDFDTALVSILDDIYFEDQSTRSQIRAKEANYGRDSKEMKAFWQTILKKDSVNLIKVREILDTQGWPSKKRIGKKGTSTLFLVLQHANLETQSIYFPLIKKAMRQGYLPKRQYAMFHDRLLLGQGKKQLYGTQLAMDKASKKPYVLPLEKPVHVDKRRAEMRLNTMQENLNRWNIRWDVQAYLKILPSLVEKEKKLNKNK